MPCSRARTALTAALLWLASPVASFKAYGVPGKGPPVKRAYPRGPDQLVLEYWMTGGSLSPCTVDNVRGLQKCVKVVGIAARGTVDASLDEALEALIGAGVPYRVLTEAGTLEDVSVVCFTAAAGAYLIGKQPRVGAGAASGASAPSPTRGLFNILGKATEAVSIFGLADDAGAAAGDDAEEQ